MFKRPRAPKWIDGSLRCSFCGKAKSEVAKLIAGPGVYICNECVGLCSEIIEKEQDSEAIQPGEAVSFTLLQEQLHSVLDTLSEREAGVVSMRFGLTDGQPKTLDEIGKVYGVTRERIRQIESKIMSKLRPTDGRQPMM